MEIKEFVTKFAEAIEIEDVTNLAAETKFRDLEEWSSISVMLVIAFYDEEFEKEVSTSDLRACSTIQDLYNLAIS